MKPSTTAWALGLLLLVDGCAPHPAADVPFLVTPPEIVDQMLRLARVGPDDVVYDLGSGDGRLVIAAVRDFRARRGVGIEIRHGRLGAHRDDPRGRERARHPGVSAGAAPALTPGSPSG